MNDATHTDTPRAQRHFSSRHQTPYVSLEIYCIMYDGASSVVWQTLSVRFMNSTLSNMNVEYIYIFCWLFTSFVHITIIIIFINMIRVNDGDGVSCFCVPFVDGWISVEPAPGVVVVVQISLASYYMCVGSSPVTCHSHANARVEHSLYRARRWWRRLGNAHMLSCMQYQFAFVRYIILFLSISISHTHTHQLTSVFGPFILFLFNFWSAIFQQQIHTVYNIVMCISEKCIYFSIFRMNRINGVAVHSHA